MSGSNARKTGKFQEKIGKRTGLCAERRSWSMNIRQRKETVATARAIIAASQAEGDVGGPS